MKKGYTLVELLIVMTIISILAGAGFNFFGQSISKTVKDNFEEDIAGIVKIEEYIKKTENKYVFFNYTTKTKYEYIDLNSYESLSRSDFRPYVKFSNTSIRVYTDPNDSECFNLTASLGNLSAVYNNCTYSRIRITES